MIIEELEKALQDKKQPKFRLEQIKKAIFKDGASSFSAIREIPKELAQFLDETVDILPFVAVQVLISEDRRSFKALLKLKDGNLIETVLLLPRPTALSVCVSSQAGCPLGCKFCATGRSGFKRNLTADEISSQVLFWRQQIKKLGDSDFKFAASDIKNIVYMGMGEPLLNWENVKESLRMLIDPKLFAFGSRSISVSTSGIAPGIKKFAEEMPQVNLALSLHFADNQKRSQFMPINKKHDLFDLKKAIQSYLNITQRKVFIEYLMIDGVNDSKEDAEDLVKYIKSMKDSYLLHVNLIRYNATSEILKPSSKEKIQEFRDYLMKRGVNTTIRQSLGEEIKAACGQLAAKV
ncbi:MAG TPA: 23S rRNA (adenine(2503)-C(2))-methyltransferase RlmN [Candidatus Paceibacterota bacterium]|nr:23S rRNA (adenine(2503)-C(2))-methyltransferase RlmN [Candidatus Paceibacterota bacterium]HRY76844.1 23S rRNA (adenine(2503)-C(2))-methyltransferase RlmN [Candidatus Paceibacterota bacterium]